MALYENQTKKSLVLKLRTGKTEEGKDIFARQRLSGVKESASIENIWQVADIMRSLVKYETVDIGVETASSVFNDAI